MEIVFSKNEFIEKDAEGVLWNWLIPNAQKNMMEPVLVELAEGMETSEDIPHEGEEFGYVLEGKIAILLGNRHYLCKKGEAFYLQPAINSAKSFLLPFSNSNFLQIVLMYLSTERGCTSSTSAIWSNSNPKATR